MNCRDLEELLSAYVDGELVGTQRDFVEEHLASCADCRAILADYTKTREQLLSLRVTPIIPDIKEATMLKIKMAEAPAKLRRWLRPALVGIPIIIILAAVLSLHLSGSFSSYKSVIAKAYAAVEKLESFRYTKEEYTQKSETSEPVHSYHAEVEYTTPDRYHLITERNQEDPVIPNRTETIRIGDQVYVNLVFVPYKFEAEWYDQFTPTKDRTLEFLNLLSEIDTMPDEVIDGTDCYHYAGVVDMEKFLEWSRPNFEKMYSRMLKNLPGIKIDKDAYIERFESSFRNQEITFEFWIGKDDYLVRQGKLLYQTLPGEFSAWNPYKSISILKYSDFNESIIIEPPLDESGELLDGWLVYTLEE